MAYRNNKVTQRRIADEGGIPILVQILLNPPSEEVQVEVAISLACVVLSNRENQEKLQEEPNFKFDILLDLLRSRNEVRGGGMRDLVGRGGGMRDLVVRWRDEGSGGEVEGCRIWCGGMRDLVVREGIW